MWKQKSYADNPKKLPNYKLSLMELSYFFLYLLDL